MIITKFGQFILRGRREAVFLALLFTLIPFLHWVSAVVIAVVTLRRGIYEGFIVFMWAAMPYVVLTALGFWLPLVGNVFCGSLLVWAFASLLRYVQWSRLIEISAGFAVFVIVIIHVFFAPLAAWWTHQIVHSINIFTQQASWIKLDANQIKQVATKIAPYATGIQTAMILLVDWISLMIARYVEGTITRHPHRLKKEWLRVRLHYLATAIFVICLALLYVVHWTVMKDVLPVVAIAFLVAGTSLIHAYLNKSKRPWVSFFYIIVILSAAFCPALLIVLLAAAMIDSIFDIRKHIGHLNV